MADDQCLPRLAGFPCASVVVAHVVSQGAAIMIMSLVLFETEFLHIVSISFTALILNELIMVALEITTWYVLLLWRESDYLPRLDCQAYLYGDL